MTSGRPFSAASTRSGPLSLPWEGERVWADVRKRRIYIPIRNIREREEETEQRGKGEKGGKKGRIYKKGRKEGQIQMQVEISH